MRCSRSLIATVFAIAAFCALPARGAPNARAIDEAIAHLGDPDPATREQAAKVLREAGPAARPALEAAVRGDDPEIAARAREILRAVPSAAAAAVPADETLPGVVRYRASTAESKSNVIAQLANTPVGIRALTKLWVIETDPDLRGEIYKNLMSSPSLAGAALLADGSVGTAELLLTASLDQGANDSVAAYVSYWLGRGRLDEAIRRWSGRGGKQPADAVAEQVLSALYRAKGDANAALTHARNADDLKLLHDTLIWAGDWAGLAADLHRQNIVPHAARDLAMITGADALSGDKAAMEADFQKLAAIVNRAAIMNDRDALSAAHTLLLLNRPDETVKLLIEVRQYSGAYEVLCARGQFDAATALLADRDADTSQEAMLLRCAAASEFVREGLKPQADSMIARLTGENTVAKYPRVCVALAEAERAMGMDEKAWGHFADAVDMVSTQGETPLWYVAKAFPGRQNGVAWAQLWETAQTHNRKRTARELFSRIRSVYDGTMPIDELTGVITSVDLSSPENTPYERLAWEAALRMKKKGHPSEAVKFVEGIAATSADGDLYLDLGDWAVEEKDWDLAAKRYESAWLKDRTQALPLYLQGWALERGGHAGDGREKMQLAQLLPLGDENRRQEFILGLSSRGLEDAAVRQADVLIRTGDPTSGDCEVALRVAADRADERGDCAVAAALWQRSVASFLGGNFWYPVLPYYLHLPDQVRRSRARALLAAGDWAGAQREIDASLEILPADTSVAIDLVPELDKLGKHQEADALYGKIMSARQAICDRFPDSSFHHNELAWLAAKCHRDLDKALDHAKRAVAGDPKSAADIDTLAEVYYQRGDFEQAVTLEKQCVELNPELQIHRQQLARFEGALKKK